MPAPMFSTHRSTFLRLLESLRESEMRRRWSLSTSLSERERCLISRNSRVNFLKSSAAELTARNSPQYRERSLITTGQFSSGAA